MALLLAELAIPRELEELLKTFVVQAVLSLYIVINPAGVSSVFLGVTRNSSPGERRLIALRAAVTGAIFLAAFAVAGTYIFRALRISGAALQIAGGFIVFGLASALARGKESEFFGHLEDTTHEKARRSVAYSPLAVPLIAGPASITVVMTLSAQAQGKLGLIVLLAAIGLVVFLCFLSMLRVLKLAERFGPGISLIMPRLMGLLLAVIAIQFIVQGVKQIMPDLAQAWQQGVIAANEGR